MDWNPRFVWYAMSHGMTPEEMTRVDEEAWPGGCMTGFILWIADRRREFKTISPRSFCGDFVADDLAWDKYLEQCATTDRNILAEKLWQTLDNGLTPD